MSGEEEKGMADEKKDPPTSMADEILSRSPEGIFDRVAGGGGRNDDERTPLLKSVEHSPTTIVPGEPIKSGTAPDGAVVCDGEIITMGRMTSFRLFDRDFAAQEVTRTYPDGHTEARVFFTDVTDLEQFNKGDGAD